VLSVLVLASLALPAASVAAPAMTDATTSPSPVIPLTDTVYVGPVPVTVAANVPAAVLPVKSMSEASKPVTASLNTTVNSIGETFVGSA